MTLICGALPTETTQVTSVAHSMPPTSRLERRLLQRVLGVTSLISSLMWSIRRLPLQPKMVQSDTLNWTSLAGLILIKRS